MEPTHLYPRLLAVAKARLPLRIELPVCALAALGTAVAAYRTYGPFLAGIEVFAFGIVPTFFAAGGIIALAILPSLIRGAILLRRRHLPTWWFPISLAAAVLLGCLLHFGIPHNDEWIFAASAPLLGILALAWTDRTVHDWLSQPASDSRRSRILRAWYQRTPLEHAPWAVPGARLCLLASFVMFGGFLVGFSVARRVENRRVDRFLAAFQTAEPALVETRRGEPKELQALLPAPATCKTDPATGSYVVQAAFRDRVLRWDSQRRTWLTVFFDD